MEVSAKNVRDKTEAKPSGSTHSLTRKVLLVGSPNVGKSMLFNRLTGRYVIVSNYPGTTVELSKGAADIAGHKYEIIDTPGMYSLSPITDEEKVASDLLLKDHADAVVHVIDAKNIQRMLGLTLQLIEASLPVILVLNMSDEARQLGIHIDSAKLEELLQIPVVETVAISGKGTAELLHRIHHARPARSRLIDYPAAIENAISAIAEQLEEDQHLSCRTRSLLLLQADPQAMDTCPVFEKNVDIEFVKDTTGDCLSKLDHSVHYHLTWAIQEEVKSIVAGSVKLPDSRFIGFREKLSRFCMHPVAGLPILFVVLYFGIYKFVGGFGAGILVDFLESNIFELYINPFVVKITSDWISWQPLYDLIAGEYGVITLGIRYAIAIVLPIVGTFFIAFSILEDSGYLPRLAMLIDRLFKRLGLNGRAVIPIVLGFGCTTMATMVTRTLESKREKVIASILLALAIPCSAQFGVILGLLATHPYALLAWALFVGAVFVLVGTLLARFFPGEKPSFYMELPPLRLPRLANVFIKTYSRMVWYFKEILPLFILASFLIWLGDLTGIFQWTIKMLTPLVNAIGLPDDASIAFIFGFFRRDYGVAGLYDLQKGGMMTGNQLAVAAITLTLFLPCIAQFLVFKKECGFKIAAITSVCICIIAFTVGFIANSVFNIFGLVL
ncbi:MAG: ferrous iron transport protein B [Planctomycetes bacterium]|nr:ferrous iron transport protein B [Planctomycetota bacterium]